VKVLLFLQGAFSEGIISKIENGKIIDWSLPNSRNAERKKDKGYET